MASYLKVKVILFSLSHNLHCILKSYKYDLKLGPIWGHVSFLWTNVYVLRKIFLPFSFSQPFPIIKLSKTVFAYLKFLFWANKPIESSFGIKFIRRKIKFSSMVRCQSKSFVMEFWNRLIIRPWNQMNSILLE